MISRSAPAAFVLLISVVLLTAAPATIAGQWQFSVELAVGTGRPLVYVSGWLSHLQLSWELPEERALLERIIGRGLVDVQRALHPDDAEMFTWWAPWRNMRQRNIGWRLDYVLASTALATRAQSCEVQREFGTSDHGPVIATFA